MATEILTRRLADEYLATLKNRNVAHSRVFLIFSGVPGSGKTTLAQRLRDDLKAQYVRHDDIRDQIRADGLNPADFIIAEISSYVIDTIMTKDPNKFVIIDASLDRTWPRFFEHAKEHDALPIVIRLDVPKEVVSGRIKDRPEGHVGKVSGLDRYYEQLENSKKHVPATLTLSLDYDYSDVLSKIKSLV